MGSSIYSIGTSGMNAAMAGLVTTGQNIANASTPGYSRQEIVQAANLPQATGSGFLGQGVSVITVKRIYSDVIANQLTVAQAQGSHLDAYNAQITQLDNMLGDPTAGLTPALQNFFTGVAAVAATPADVTSRQAMLSSANSLTATFQRLDQQIEQMRSGVNAGISNGISSINGYAQQIAGLNKTILATESSTGQPANDLRDQRDSLVASLNQQIGASVVKGSNGSYDVFVGNGQPIVLGNQAINLVAARSPQDPQRLEVGYQSGASTVLLPESGIQGGSLGGLISFRSNSLDPAQNALGRIAITVAQKFNAQSALGQDLNGALGKPLFTVAGPTVLQSSGNSGSASVTAAVQNASALTTSDYRLQYMGASGGNENYQLTRVSDGTTTAISFPTAAGSGSVNVDGIALNLTTGAATNDSWLIEPTRTGASSIAVALTDPAAIAAASPVGTSAALSNAGSGTISAASVTSVANLPLPGTVTLTYDAAANQFTVSGAVPAAGPFSYTAGSPISFNGISIAISGTPANGDQFTLGPNTNGTSDNSNALALAALQTANTMGQDASVAGSQPTTSFGGAYTQLVTQVANIAQQTGVMDTAQQNVIAQATHAQQSVSGVNLDEEAANLLRYQQAYQAAGKMMQIANTLFQAVLALEP
ncbi:MAG TPA: flagellar hook-associated protein FlgK [Burkholderiales bacterium]|nr:flagellar hook-associated protein FlgK [Burkholderiales bacterium]